MPKRDAAYMEGQREMIAQAALACMLDQGLSRTSIRDICLHAGVSIGAFYNHFADRAEVIVAACAIGYEAYETWAAAGSWREYADGFRELPKALKDPLVLKRLRVSYEFIAELTQVDTNPAGVNDLYVTVQDAFRAALARIAAAGEITLPLGLDKTADLHARLYWGTTHALMVNHDLDPATLVEELIDGLGVLAGLKVGKGAQ